MAVSRYDSIARDYGTGEDAYEHPPVAALLGLVGAVRDERVLDLACGHGLVARQLARLGAQVVGLDLSDGLLQVAREREGLDPLGVRYVHGDAAGPVLEAETFDVVTCNFGLSDIDDLRGVLRTVHRLLSRNGRLVFSILLRRGLVETPGATVGAAT